MATTIRIKRNDLPKVAAKLPTEVGVCLTKFIHDVDAHATADTPVETGKLKASKSVEVNDTEGTIHWSAEYAAHVHDGTRHMAGQPFAADAVEKCKPAFDAALRALESKIT